MPDSVEKISLTPGALPGVSLTGDILYRLLVSEFAAQGGEFGLAATTLLDLARETSDPRLAQRAFQAGMAARDLPSALRAAQLWANLAPGDPDAVAASLALSATNGEVDGMAQSLRQRVQEATDKTQAVIQAAGIVGRMSDKSAALAVLTQALQPWAGKLEIVHLALADIAADAGDAERAFDEARRAWRLAPDSDEAMQRLLEYGWEVDPEAALADARAYADRRPDSRKLQLMLVNRLSMRGDQAEALRRIADMRRRNPEDFDLMYYEAQLHVQASQYAPARALLQEYIDVQTQRRRTVRDEASNAESRVSDARLLLVRIAEREGKLDEAMAQLDRVVEAPLRFQAQVHKAVLQGRQGQVAQARATLEALRPQDDHERSVLALTLASIYREAGRSDEALKVLRQADADMPDSPAIKYDLAMLYQRQGRQAEFEALLRRIIEIEPDHANAHNALGYTYADQNRRLDEARELLERAIELEPDNAYIQDSVGWYLYRAGDLEGALTYLFLSYENLPSAEVAAHLGEVLWKLNQRDEARRIWREGLEHEADNEVLLETLKRFKVKKP